MKKLTACLGLALGFFFLLGAVCARGEEVVVARGSGDFLILQNSAGIPVRKTLAENADQLVMARSGHFILAIGGVWYKGYVDSDLNVNKQPILIKPSCNEGNVIAISEDGKRIAWVTSAYVDGARKRDLIVQEYTGDQPTLLVKLSVGDGHVFWPSWSPDGKQLAFYAGPSDAGDNDGYSLMLMNVDAADKQPVSITPPSLWSLSMLYSDSQANRGVPPLWSPDGKSIIFEGCYQEFDQLKVLYHVAVDGRRLVACNCWYGAWDPEGKHYYTLKAKGKDHNLGCVIVDVDVLQDGKERVVEDLKFPDGLLEGLKPSPSAKKVAYIQNRVLAGVPPAAQRSIMSHGLAGKDDVLFIYDSTTKKTVSFGPDNFSFMYPPIWIIPQPAIAKPAIPVTKAPDGPTVKLTFPEKKLKNKRLAEVVAKIRDKEIEQNHVQISPEDAKAITKFFLKENGVDEVSFKPDQDQLQLCLALEDVRVRNIDKNEAYKTRFVKSEYSKDIWENMLGEFKTAEAVREFRARVSANFEELVSHNSPRIQKRAGQWRLFQKVTGADGKIGRNELQEREWAWWTSRLPAYRDLIDEDMKDNEILVFLANQFELSAAKEVFLQNYFAKKAAGPKTSPLPIIILLGLAAAGGVLAWRIRKSPLTEPQRH